MLTHVAARRRWQGSQRRWPGLSLAVLSMVCADDDGGQTQQAHVVVLGCPVDVTHFGRVLPSLPAAGGGLIGIGYGIATRFILRFLQRFGATAEQQIALTLACGYLSFYTANAPAKVSGGC